MYPRGAWRRTTPRAYLTTRHKPLPADKIARGRYTGSSSAPSADDTVSGGGAAATEAAKVMKMRTALSNAEARAVDLAARRAALEASA